MQVGESPPVICGTAALRANRVHVVGVAGSGVRGLVPLFLARGAKVSGSDLHESPVLERFRHHGVECCVGHSDRNVEAGTDLVLISAAIRKDNPEVQAANRQRIAVLKYAQCLGFLMSEKQGIAIAGTHGKTTTSAMVAFTLMEAGLDPSFVIGGDHPAFGGNSRSGDGSHFVAEACEYDRSFLNLRPKAAVVTNIEEEHLDYFKSLAEIRAAFTGFVSLLPEDGYLLYNADDPNCRSLKYSSRAKAEGFSAQPGGAHWSVENLLFEQEGEGTRFDLRGPGGKPVPVRLKVPGVHNVRNALACAAVCNWAGVPLERVAISLGRFTGVKRRFDVLLREPVMVVDDYAHHPTEVSAVLRAARQAYPGRRLICVFQPHQHSRLRLMLHSFADALGTADDVLVARVFRARDSADDVKAIRARVLVEALETRGCRSYHTPEFEDVIQTLKSTVMPGDLVLFLGAGDITELARRFAQLKTSSTGRRSAPSGRRRAGMRAVAAERTG